MKWQVSIREAADADVRQARAWYNGRRPGLGDEFLLAITDALTRLEEAPEQFPVYYREFRRVLIDRFPYKIFFRIENGAAIVFRVLHAASEHRRKLK